MMNKHRRGFTLVELLVVMTIIGLLSTIATVNYSSSRMKARDARRLADMDAFRTALELYNTNQGGFPGDKAEGSEGLVLGSAGGKRFSSIGFSDKLVGEIYMETIPSNPLGGGANYLYYSLNNDGTHCVLDVCPSYSIEFVLEAPENTLAAGAYASTPSGTARASPAEAAKILAHTVASPADRLTTEVLPVIDSTVATINQARNDPTVVSVSNNVVAPISSVAAVISTATGLSSVGTTGVAAQTVVSASATAASAAGALGQIGALFFLLLTHPFLLLSKRKEYAWGVVYDAQKKLPIDLAIVRLIDDSTKRVVQTRVTDKAGRIFFFVGKGTYRLEALKPGYAFPSTSMAGEREDGNFANLYFGQKFSVSGSGMVVNPSVPLDPVGADLSDQEFVKRFVHNNLRYSVSLIGLALTFIAFAIKPSVLVGGLFILNLALFFIFRRLSRPEQPAEWGTVKDEKTGAPLSHAVVRLFSSPYNKLVETRVTDSRGRYNFVVGQNVFYLTATREGYWKTQSFSLDLRGSRKPEVIAAPVRLRPITESAALDASKESFGEK